jgi:ABC-type Fe3+ transport system permease subunit
MSDPVDARYGKDGRSYAEAIAAGAHLGEQEQQIASSYDKHLLTLASGALALSIGFVEKVAPHPVWTVLLFAAWAAFGLCILANLLAILFAQESITRHAVLNRCRYEQEPGSFSDDNPWERRVGYANWTSLLLFVVGVLLMIVFSGINQKGSFVSKPTEVQKAAKGPVSIKPAGQSTQQGNAGSASPSPGGSGAGSAPPSESSKK